MGSKTVWPTLAASVVVPIFQRPQAQVYFGDKVTELDIASTTQFKRLSKLELWLMNIIAIKALTPALDKAGLFPHKEFIKLYQPRIFKIKTLDGLNLRCYWLPAVNISEKKLALDSEGSPTHTKTFVMGHGHTSSPTALLSMANTFRLLGYNVMLPVFRAHEKSDGLTTDIGFHSGQDIAAVCKTLEATYPNQKRRYLGYSMGAAALMMSPKTLTMEALDPKIVKSRGITDEQLKSQRELIEQFGLIILDSPYADFDLISWPTTQNNLSEATKKHAQLKKIFSAGHWYKKLKQLSWWVESKEERYRPEVLAELPEDPTQWVYSPSVSAPSLKTVFKYGPPSFKFFACRILSKLSACSKTSFAHSRSFRPKNTFSSRRTISPGF